MAFVIGDLEGTLVCSDAWIIWGQPGEREDSVGLGSRGPQSDLEQTLGLSTALALLIHAASSGAAAVPSTPRRLCAVS